jgi:hypothetical protein
MSSVGKNVDAQCTKCGLLLAHVVLYEVNGAIARVKCKTCGAEHKYRGTKPLVTKSEILSLRNRPVKTKVTAAVKQSSSDDRLRWIAKNRELTKDVTVLPYHIADIYKKGEAFLHPSFGIGFVEKIVNGQQIHVLFEDSLKYMAMNINPS